MIQAILAVSALTLVTSVVAVVHIMRSRPDAGPVAVVGISDTRARLEELAVELSLHSEDPLMAYMAANKPRWGSRRPTNRELSFMSDVLQSQRSEPTARLVVEAAIMAGRIEELAGRVASVEALGARRQPSAWAIAWGLFGGFAAIATVVAATISVLQAAGKLT